MGQAGVVMSQITKAVTGVLAEAVIVMGVLGVLEIHLQQVHRKEIMVEREEELRH